MTGALSAAVVHVATEPPTARDLPGWHLGGTVAHLLVDLGTSRPRSVRYVSRCGGLTLAAPRPAADRVPACRSCQRVAYGPARARGAAGAPYRPGDRATVLHADRHGTTVGVLRVQTITARMATEAGVARWVVVFEVAQDDRAPWTVTVSRDGRDLHGYVEPIRGAL